MFNLATLLNFIYQLATLYIDQGKVSQSPIPTLDYGVSGLSYIHRDLFSYHHRLVSVGLLRAPNDQPKSAKLMLNFLW